MHAPWRDRRADAKRLARDHLIFDSIGRPQGAAISK
jgi:hypothetical protein